MERSIARFCANSTRTTGQRFCFDGSKNFALSVNQARRLNIIGSLTGQNPDGIISVDADESLGRIFGGSYTSFGFVNSTAYAFDPFRYQPLASLNVPGPSGSVMVLPRLLRWGQDGIAFQGEPGFSARTRLYSVESPSFVLPQNAWPNPVPDAGSVSPATVSVGSPNLRLHIKGSDFVRGAVVSLVFTSALQN